MNQLLKDYLSFSKRERRGGAVLAAIIVALLAAPYVQLIYQSHFGVDYDDAGLNAQLSDFLQKQMALGDSLSSTNEKHKIENPGQAFSSLFFFDPNKATEAEWLKLGLKPGLVKTILNYRSKGGKFYKKEDVRKMYGMDEQTFMAIEPYINLGQKRHQTEIFTSNQKEWKEKASSFVLVEINGADSIELTKIRGIGEKFASRIVRYRDLLGGFVNKSQLTEVYGLNPEKLEEISSQVEINNLVIKKLNINKCSIEELARHPYIKWNLANSIVRIREQHGAYGNTSEIQRSDLVNDELYRKLAPYLTIE